MSRNTTTPTTSTSAQSTSTASTHALPSSRASWFDVFRNGLAIYTLTMNLAIGLHAIDVFIIATVMPKVVRDIGGTSFYTWPTMLYMVASIIGAASGNPLKGIMGSRRAYILGSLLFLIGSIGCAEAPAMSVMLVARILQGWGGGLLISLSMAMVQEFYPEHLRKRALALISTTWGIAALLGPAIGGLFAEHGWWRGAFWFNAPIIALFLVGAWWKLPRHRAGGPVARFPYRRLALLSIGVFAVGLAAQVAEILRDIGVDLGNPVWHHAVLPIQIALIVLAVVMVRVTIVMDKGKTGSRLLPTKPFSLITTTGIAGWVMFLSSITHTVLGSYLPLALQTLCGASDAVAAYIMACLAIFWTVGSVATSGLHETAARRCICIGLAISSIGLIGLTASLATAPLIVVAALDALVGLGLGITNLHLTAATMRHAMRGEEALTASAIPTIRSLGISFGAAGAGVIANSTGLVNVTDPGQVGTAIHWVLVLGCAAPIIACLFALRFVSQVRRLPETTTVQSEQVFLTE
jgi:MFS family permease